MKRLAISLPDEMWEAIKEEAERMGDCAPSAVIRRAVREYFQRQVTEEAKALVEQVQRAVAPLTTGENNGHKALK